MKNLAILVTLIGLLAGCGVPVPIIDAEGRDQVQLNRDLARCQVSTSNTFAWGNPIATCMKAKGYRPMGVY